MVGRAVAWERYWSAATATAADGPGEFTRWCLPWLRRIRATSVLDLGCGPGRDLAFLVSRGFRVTGVDLSAEAARRARRGLRALPPDVARRGRVLRKNLLDALASTPPGSIDAVHAATTYQTLTDRELRAVFAGVRRALRPGGVHLWSVRSVRHPGRTSPDRVAPNRGDGRPLVPLRFFGAREVDRLSATGFVRWRREVVSRFSTFYVVDRSPPVVDSPRQRPVSGGRSRSRRTRDGT